MSNVRTSVSEPRRLGATLAAALRLPPLLTGLSTTERRHVLAAFGELSSVESRLRGSAGGFKELVERARAAVVVPTSDPVHPLDPKIDQVMWSVRVASRCFPRAECLSQTFAAYFLLRRLGIPVTLVVGVAPRRRTFAHAWLQSGDSVLAEGTANTLAYRPILRVPEGSSWIMHKEGRQSW